MIDVLHRENVLSLKTYRSIGEDEGGQLSSSLAVIHMVGAMKMLLKSLHNLPFHTHHPINKGPTLLAVHMPETRDVNRGGEGERGIGGGSQKGSSLWPFSSILFIEVPYVLTLMNPV